MPTACPPYTTGNLDLLLKTFWVEMCTVLDSGTCKRFNLFLPPIVFFNGIFGSFRAEAYVASIHVFSDRLHQP